MTEHAHLLLQLGGMLHTTPGLVPGVDELPRSLTGVRLPVALWLATATPRCEPLMSARRRHPATRGVRTDLRRTGKVVARRTLGTQVAGPNHAKETSSCSLAVQPSTRVSLAQAVSASLSLLDYYSCTGGLFAPRHVAARQAAASRPWKRRALTLACEEVSSLLGGTWCGGATRYAMRASV